MSDETPVTVGRAVIRWAVVLGVAGFVSGFVGPMVFAPESNQGPMLGIFITGPAAALLGAILGVAVGAMNVSAATAARLLAGAAALVAATTLYFSVPEPRYYPTPSRARSSLAPRRRTCATTP